jgi:primase-polymerase (primpol)-like protein
MKHLLAPLALAALLWTGCNANREKSSIPPSQPEKEKWTRLFDGENPRKWE